MNKKLIIFLTIIIAGCQVPISDISVRAKDLYNYIANFQNLDAKSLENADIPFSYIVVHFNGMSARLILLNAKSDIYEWISEDGVRIYTFNGKVIKTQGLENDIEISGFDSNLASNSSNFYISFFNPDLPFLQARYTLERESDTEKIFNLQVNKIFLNEHDTYKFLDDELLSTKQFINFEQGYIEILFKYKKKAAK